MRFDTLPCEARPRDRNRRRHRTPRDRLPPWPSIVDGWRLLKRPARRHKRDGLRQHGLPDRRVDGRALASTSPSPSGACVRGAPPQTSPGPVVGELENREYPVPMTFSTGAPGHTSQAPRPHGQGVRCRNGRHQTGTLGVSTPQGGAYRPEGLVPCPAPQFQRVLIAFRSGLSLPARRALCCRSGRGLWRKIRE